MDLIEFYCVLWGFGGTLMSISGLNWDELGFTGFYKVFYWVSTEYLMRVVGLDRVWWRFCASRVWELGAFLGDLPPSLSTGRVFLLFWFFFGRVLFCFSLLFGFREETEPQPGDGRVYRVYFGSSRWPEASVATPTPNADANEPSVPAD